jgi:hypothetical protein
VGDCNIPNFKTKKKMKFPFSEIWSQQKIWIIFPYVHSAHASMLCFAMIVV